MVFCFDSNTSRDAGRGIEPRPFRFLKVLGAKLTKDEAFALADQIGQDGFRLLGAVDAPDGPAENIRKQ